MTSPGRRVGGHLLYDAAVVVVLHEVPLDVRLAGEHVGREEGRVGKRKGRFYESGGTGERGVEKSQSTPRPEGREGRGREGGWAFLVIW